jgi:hypothetical protein
MTTATKTQFRTSRGSKIKFQPDQSFDSKKMRHYLGGQVAVMHCHHYSTLFTQLAIDSQQFNGPSLLVEASFEAFWSVLRDYYKKNKITDVNDRIAVAEQYYSFVGMGEVEFEVGDNSAVVTMKHSHVDEGWLKKWGPRNQRVNYMGEGYIKAALGAILNENSPHKYRVSEVQSIVCGASTSRFNVTWN